MPKVFEHIICDKESAINKIRIIEGAITIYFNESDFDSMHNIKINFFTPFNEKALFHEGMHNHDEDRNNPHIHYIKKSIGSITEKDLIYIMGKLITSQINPFNKTSFFKIKPFISEKSAINLIDSYKEFLSLNNQAKKIKKAA